MKRKIAILGGGCGSMAAAWALTHLPDADQKFDITVYQMGWRLGGKGASGRDEQMSFRILEHGLHVWGGFYENAFRVMQQVYGELPQDPSDPLLHWDDAFKKLSTVVLQENIDGKIINWNIDFPENDAVPGVGGELPTLWDYIELFLNFFHTEISKHTPPPATPIADAVRAETLNPSSAPHRSLFARLFPSHFAETLHTDASALLLLHHPADLAIAAKFLASSLGSDITGHPAVAHDDLVQLVDHALLRFEEEIGDRLKNDENNLRRVLMILDLGAATLRGFIREGVLAGGLEAINRDEWKAWLLKHGAKETTANGPIVRGIYDYVFGFAKGVIADRALEAGTASYGVLRLFFTFKGAIFWEMQAGMGDVVFGSMYRALKARGVKFSFFHKVTNLGVDAEGKTVDRIEMLQQATIKGAGAYEPLIRVGGVYAWPADPQYEQLVEGKELMEHDINLESNWSPWTGTPVTLQRGVDFDEVILGISLGAFNDVAKEVKGASKPFASMVDNVGTVQTAAVQLWLDSNAVDIGASEVRRASTAGVEPLSTWSDMSFLLEREQWPAGSAPQFIAYFCGVFPDAEVIPPPSDHDFPAAEIKRWKATAIDWLQNNTATIWSKATDPQGGGLRWSLLHDPDGRDGMGRLDAQFLRVNIDPSERYVASFPNTSQFRLRAGESGISNLFLTGDWVRTAFNAGCVEAAVMAGLHAAMALSGEKINVIG